MKRFKIQRFGNSNHSLNNCIEVNMKLALIVLCFALAYATSFEGEFQNLPIILFKFLVKF